MFSIGILVLLVVILSVTTEGFLTPNNIFTLLRDAAPIGIIAIGVSLVLFTGGIDLSTGALVGFVSMIGANLLYYTNLPAGLIMLIVLVAAIVCGYCNGLLVTTFHLPPFIATLATQFVFRGLCLVMAIRNETGMITNQVIKSYPFLFLGGSINGVYLVTIAWIILVVIFQFVIKKTKLGVYTFATGTNENAASMSGINTARTKRIAYTICGLMCGIAALFLMGKIKSVTQDTGKLMEFDVISSVVVGGIAFSGGHGDIIGGVIGTLFMNTLTNGIYKYNLSLGFQVFAKGAVIVIMIIFDSVYNFFMQKRQIKEKAALEELEEKKEAQEAVS